MAAPRVAPGQWDPEPGLRGLAEAAQRARAAHSIFSCLASLETFMRPDPTRAAWSDEDAAATLIETIQATLLERLIDAPDLDATDLSRVVSLVRADHLLRPSTPHVQRLGRLLTRVDHALAAAAQLSNFGADAELRAVCERLVNRGRHLNAKDHPEAERDFEDMSEYPEHAADEAYVAAARPRTLSGLVGLARVALHEAWVARPDAPGAVWQDMAAHRTALRVLTALATAFEQDAAQHVLSAPGLEDKDGENDRGLIDRCDDFVRRQREAWRLEEPFCGRAGGMPREVRAQVDALNENYQARLDEITGFAAGTAAGLRAKARALEAHLTRNDDGSWEGSDAPAGSLIDDIFALIPAEGPALASTACPAASLIPDIVAAEQDYRATDCVTNDTLREKAREHIQRQVIRRSNALWRLVETTRPASAAGAMLALLAAIRHADDLDTSVFTEEQVSEKAEAARNLIAGAYYVLERLHGGSGLETVREAYIGLFRYSLATRGEYETALRATRAECGL